MNKAELISVMAEKAGLTKIQAKAALESFINAASESLQQDDKVSLLGFGTFSTVNRAARKGRNPQTKKEMIIPAKRVIKFKAGAELNAKL